MVPLLLVLCVAALASAQDADRDGLADRLEQELLDRYAPRFLVDSSDCDVLPSTFAPGSEEPRSIARNGRIYGQVFPVRPGGELGEYVEAHYYHLWNRDCGRRGHPLDSEHVSVLLRNTGKAHWEAVYWFASAHQGTLCEASQAAPAAIVAKGNHGPTVWISEGKHASFLSLAGCAGGCGADRCGLMVEIPKLPIVNIGERGAPMNGASWLEAKTWPTGVKTSSDFQPAVLQSLAGSQSIVEMRKANGVRTTIAVSSVSAEAVGTGRDHTQDALETAQRKTTGSLQRAHKAVKNWFRRFE